MRFLPQVSPRSPIDEPCSAIIKRWPAISIRHRLCRQTYRERLTTFPRLNRLLKMQNCRGSTARLNSRSVFVAGTPRRFPATIVPSALSAVLHGQARCAKRIRFERESNQGWHRIFGKFKFLHLQCMNLELVTMWLIAHGRTGAKVTGGAHICSPLRGPFWQ